MSRARKSVDFQLKLIMDNREKLKSQYRNSFSTNPAHQSHHNLTKRQFRNKMNHSLNAAGRIDCDSSGQPSAAPHEPLNENEKVALK